MLIRIRQGQLQNKKKEKALYEKNKSSPPLLKAPAPKKTTKIVKPVSLTRSPNKDIELSMNEIKEEVQESPVHYDERAPAPVVQQESVLKSPVKEDSYSNDFQESINERAHQSQPPAFI